MQKLIWQVPIVSVIKFSQKETTSKKVL